MFEIVGIKRADVSDVAIGRVGRDGRDVPVSGFDLLCPVLLVFQRDLARDVFQGDVAGKIDEVLDRCPLGLLPQIGPNLVHNFRPFQAKKSKRIRKIRLFSMSCVKSIS